MWPCPSVDDTISNLLWHALFERARKLKCRMLLFFLPPPRPPSPRIFLYSYTAEGCSEHDFVAEPVINSPGPVLSTMCGRVCVLLESSSLCQRNSAQPSFYQFISSPPAYPAKTSQSSTCLLCDSTQQT